MSVNRDDEERKVLVLGAAHHNTVLTLVDDIIVGHPNKATSERSFGGAGHNLAKSLRIFENSVGMVSVFSDDTLNHLILRNLQGLGINVYPILITRCLTASYTALNTNDGDFLIGALVGGIYNELTVERLKQQASKLTEKSTIAVVTDSTFNPGIYSFVAELVAQHDKRLFVVISSLDTSTNITSLLPHADGLFGSVEEISHLAGVHFEATEEVYWKSLQKIAEKGTDAVFATHGEHGVYALINGQKFYYPAHTVDKVVSTLGAGDAFAATVVDGMLKGIKPEEAIQRGLIAASLRVQDKDITREAIEQGLQLQALQKQKEKRFFNRIVLTP